MLRAWGWRTGLSESCSKRQEKWMRYSRYGNVESQVGKSGFFKIAGSEDEQFILGNNEIDTLRTWVEVTSVFYPQLGSYYERVFVE
jgi:hypothetical protein